MGQVRVGRTGVGWLQQSCGRATMLYNCVVVGCGWVRLSVNVGVVVVALVRVSVVRARVHLVCMVTFFTIIIGIVKGVL